MKTGLPSFLSGGSLTRLGTYLWRLLRPAKTVPGVIAFALLAVTASAHLGGRPMPGPAVCLVAVMLGFIIFLQMMLARDVREALLTSPDEPIPDEGVPVGARIAVGGLSLVLAFAIVATFDHDLLAANGIVWIWLGLFLAGYFVPGVIQRMPSLCVIGQVIGAPAAGFLLSSLEWEPAGRGIPEGIWTVLLMFFAMSCAVEIGDRIADQGTHGGPGHDYAPFPWPLQAPVGMMAAAAVLAYASLIGYGTYLDLGTRFAEIGVLVSIPFICGLVGLKVYPNRLMETTTMIWSRAWMVICYVLAAVVPFIWGR